MKDCVAYKDGNCMDEFDRWGFHCRCINEDYKDNQNHCVDYDRETTEGV